MSGTSCPKTRIHTPEELIPQPVIASCHLMSAKISCFICQQVTENLPTCACHVCRSCLHCSQPRSRWARDICLLTCVQEQPFWCQLSVLSGKQCDCRVGPRPVIATAPLPFPTDQKYNAVLLGMEETVIEYSEIILQFEINLFKISFSEISLLYFAVLLTHSVTFTRRWQFYVAAKIGNLSYWFRNQKCWLLLSYFVDFDIIRDKEGIPTLYWILVSFPEMMVIEFTTAKIYQPLTSLRKWQTFKLYGSCVVCSLEQLLTPDVDEEKTHWIQHRSR
jgi:hypothetical protein